MREIIDSNFIIQIVKNRTKLQYVTTMAAFRDTNQIIYAAAVLLPLALFINETVQESLPDS